MMASPWTVNWTVLVDGIDISAVMAPFLIDICITDKAGSSSGHCTLTLDDHREALLSLPRDGALIVVILEGMPVFTGILDQIRSSGSRGGGRTLHVEASGFDLRGKAKEGLSFHLDDATLKDFLSKAAEQADITLIIDDDLAAIKRDYWAAQNESFLHLGERLAREFNATFKLKDKQAVFMPRGKDLGLIPVMGMVGSQQAGNVISWDITPFSGRRLFATTKVQYFDREESCFKTEEVAASNPGQAKAANTIRTTAADKDQAKAIGEARNKEAERQCGLGTVELDLTPHAAVEALFILRGARPGVDGIYRIESVTHRASRAIKDFQRQHGLKVDGIVGTQTREALIKAVQVKRLERELNMMDGYFEQDEAERKGHPEVQSNIQPVAPKTIKELRPHSQTIREADRGTIASAAAGIGGAAVLIQSLGESITIIKESLADLPPWVLPALVIGCIAYALYALHRIKKRRLQDAQNGKVVS